MSFDKYFEPKPKGWSSTDYAQHRLFEEMRAIAYGVANGRYAQRPDHHRYALTEAQLNAQEVYEALAGPGDAPLEDTPLTPALTNIFFHFTNPEDVADTLAVDELAEIMSNQWDALGEAADFATFANGFEMLACHYVVVREKLVNEGAMADLNQAEQFTLTRHTYQMIQLPEQGDLPQ